MIPSKNTKGLVLIPAYNEERSIIQVVRGALAYLPVLVVDDGSSDQTARQARLAGAAVLSNQQNRGKGAALQAGIRQALEQGCDFVITLDSDGQHDPAEIPAFLRAFTAGQADLIIGQRDFSRMPVVRRISNTLGTCLFSWAVGKHIPDNQSGYRLISRRLLEVLHESTESGFEFEVEMILDCMMHGYSMGWVPIRTIYGDEKSHIRPLHHFLKFVQVSWRARALMKRSIRMGFLYPKVSQLK
jgi:glycosyltransferase involved in cell wall biosynthesis